MEAGGQAVGEEEEEEEEEETLQSAFKKLRVDAESVAGAVSVCEGARGASRVCVETSGAKPKLGGSREAWHGCSRKPSRGSCRSQRRRRSKSPILHPPRFTYCTAAAAAVSLSPPGGRPQLPDVSPSAARAASPPSVAETPATLPPSEASGHVTPVFGSCVASRGICCVSDFAALSDSSRPTEAQPKVYSFTGLRPVVSECEGGPEVSRTLSVGGAARSCSEQARVFVDDVTIEDLSGYMEYYLYIPKKMSHMAEMMYT